MKAKGGKSIGRKLTLFVAVIIVLAMGITGLTSYYSINSNMKNTVSTNMLSSAQDKANLLSAQIDSYKRFVGSAANSAAIKSMDKAQQQSQLKEDKAEYGFLNMGFSDSNGNVQFVDGAVEQLAYQNFYEDAQNDQTVTVSYPFADDDLKKVVVMIAAPVKSADGTKSGMVVGVIDAGIVTSMTKDITVGKSGSSFVLDETGTYVAAKDQKLVASSTNVFSKAQKDPSLAAFSKIASLMVGGKTGYAEYSQGGATQCIAYAPIKSANWFMALTAPKSELFAAADNMLKQVLFFTILFILIAIVSVMLISRRLITRPLKRTVAMVQEMSCGHIGARLKVRTNDEIGRMAAAMNSLADMLEHDVVGTMRRISAGDMTVDVRPKDEGDRITPELINTINTVNGITQQTERLIAAAKEGRLDERCDAERYKGSWRSLAEDINGLMDSVATPINEVRNVVKRLAVNDYTRAAAGSYKGLFKELADDVNGVRGRLLDLQDVMVRVSKGDMSRMTEFEGLGVLSEADSLTPAVATMMTTIDNLALEVKRLVTESVSGNIFSTRGDAGRFAGEYHEIVQGFNSALDAVSKPFIEVRSALGAMAVNDFTKSVSEGYKGDYLAMAQSIATVRENLISMQDLAVKISLGDISALEKYRSMGKRSSNDRLVPAFTAMMESIKRLIDEVTDIAESAASGQLNVRCRPEMFSGEYVVIVKSINALLDAVAKPVGLATRVMTSISQADFDVRIDGDYRGEFAQLVGAVNKTAGDLKAVVGEISSLMLRVSEGDLDIPHVEPYNGDFGVISEAIERIAASLSEVLGNINNAAGEVDSGAKGVSQGSQELSKGASAQASSVEELTASMLEISGKTKKNAEAAEKASSIAQLAKKDALDGNERMQEMLQSIEAINLASHDISKIVKVIDGIAFQTKILSLNASVEAAHAGNYGKGFAVVAAEVGNLALRSEQAAQETTELIESTIKKVESGSKIANETAAALGSIVDRADNVAKLVGGIAEASGEQAVGIAQIDHGIEQVSSVVQENSVTAQKSAAASEELSGQSWQLKQMIGRFKLRE